MLAFAPPLLVRGRIALATKYACDAIGDSFTFNTTYLTLADYYPALLQPALQILACSTVFANSGNSGDTTAQMLVRARLLPAVTPGSIGIIYGGPNDVNPNHQSTVQASPSPTTTVFAVATGFGQWFSPNTSILVGGISRVIQSVSTDTITLASALPQAPVAGATVVNDTTQNLIDIGTVMAASGYTRQMIGLQHYMNFSSQGDTLAVPDSLGVALRILQNAAASSLGATIADFYTYMRNLIVAGVDVQGSASWHVADQNTHLNAYGQSILKSCILASMPYSWLAGLRA